MTSRAPIPDLSVDAPPDPRRWLVLAVLCLSLVVVTLDNTILNVALPTMVRELGATSSQLQWITDSYTLVFAGLLLTAGSLGDRFGRKGCLTVGLVIFGLGSVLSAVSTSAGQLIVTRAVMGLGAAFVFPATLSILTNAFTVPAERTRAIAMWAATAGVGIALGPVTGGLLLEHFFWGSIFLVNIPIVITAIVGGGLVLPRSRDPHPPALDPIGAALSIVGLVSLVFAIIQGPDRGWSDPVVLASFGLALVTLTAFVVVESTSTHPMIDLQLFRNPRFSAASLTVTTIYFALFGTLFFLTQHLQFLLGYGTLLAGLSVLPFALVLMPTTILTPRLAARVGTRAIVTTGLTIIGASLLLRSTASVDTGYLLLVGTSALFALGMGLCIAPATASIMGAVPKERAGAGSAINDTTRQIGGALGVAVLGSIGASLFRSSMHHRLGPVAEGPAGNSIGAALAMAKHLPADQAGPLIDAARHAFVHAADVTSLVAALVAFGGALGAARFLPGRERVVTDEPRLDLSDLDVLHVGAVDEAEVFELL
jgi:EmrB/QacA subfamily drug resistance transporter